MALSKEFYLDEIRSKHPNSYNESLKDLPIKDLSDMLDFLDEALGKADGGSIGIEVLFQPKRGEYQTGGRTFDSRATTQDYTNALKNVSAGTTYQQQADAKRYARQEAANELRAARQGGDVALDNFLRSAGASDYRSIFTDSRPGTNRQGAFTGTYNVRKDQLLDRLMNQKLQATSYAPPSPPRDNLGLLMQDTIITDQMKSPAEMEAIRKKVLAAQKAQEQSYFLTDPVTGKKYSSQDEAIDDLGLVTYNQRFADGGRVGLFMGGPALEGQALSVYESMNAYGFTDQEIANALSAQGLYTPNKTTTTTPVINTAPNIINQGDGDGGDKPTGPTFNRNDLLGTSDYQGTGPGFIESLLGIPTALIEGYTKVSPGINFIKSIFKPKVEKINKVNIDAVAREKARQEKERAEFLAEAQRTGIASQLGGPDGTSGGKYAGGASFASANPYGGSGTMDDQGADTFYKDGGLATMFTRKR